MAEFPPKVIRKLGLEILSEVDFKELLSGGKRAFLLKGSCAGTVEVGTLTVPAASEYAQDQFDRALEQYRDRIAEDCARNALGLKPPPHGYTAVRIAPTDPDHWSSNLVSIVDWQRSETLIHKDVLNVLGILPGPDGRCDVRMEISGKEIHAKVWSAEMPNPCIIGRDLVKQVSGDVYHLHEQSIDPFGKALRDVAAAKKRSVVVIGPYGANLDRLQQIQSVASASGYHAILLKDYEDIEELSLPDKTMLFALLARFTICDDSANSGHNEELPALANAGFVVAILCPTSGPSSWMHAHLPLQSQNIKMFNYRDGMPTAVHDAILWAEQRAQEITRDWNKLYPWRRGAPGSDSE